MKVTFEKWRTLENMLYYAWKDEWILMILTKTLLPKKFKPQTTLLTTKGVKILWQWKSAESCRLSLIEYTRFCETCITLRFLFIVIHQRWTKQSLSSFVMVAFYENYKLAKSCPKVLEWVQVQKMPKFCIFLRLSPFITQIFSFNCYFLAWSVHCASV